MFCLFTPLNQEFSPRADCSTEKPTPRAPQWAQRPFPVHVSPLPMPQGKPLQVGIIGFGRIGAEHANWLTQSAGIQPAAVADVTPARADLARSRNLRVYTTTEHLLADRLIDVVLVATPTAMHFHHAMQALAAGKHVMVEKPMALDLEQATRMTREAQERNLTLSVFHNRRWDLDYLTLRRAVQANLFGQIIN